MPAGRQKITSYQQTTKIWWFTGILIGWKFTHRTKKSYTISKLAFTIDNKDEDALLGSAAQE
jgi:hypothetical protein